MTSQMEPTGAERAKRTWFAVPESPGLIQKEAKDLGGGAMEIFGNLTLSPIADEVMFGVLRPDHSIATVVKPEGLGTPKTSTRRRRVLEKIACPTVEDCANQNKLLRLCPVTKAAAPFDSLSVLMKRYRCLNRN